MQENELPPSPNADRRQPVAGRPNRSAGRHFGAQRALLAAAGAAAVFAAVEPSAFALQGGEDASTLPIIINKQSGLDGKLQVSLMFSSTLATKFTDSTGGTLNLQYNFSDWFGVEGLFGFYSVNEAQVLGTIRSTIPDGTTDPKLSDMGGMQWIGALNLVVVPIYGKISFASEWNPSFDIYVLGGGGVVGAQRGVVSPGTQVTPNVPIEPDSFRSSTEPMFNFGGGLRVFFTPVLAVRLDARNYFFTDPDAGLETFGGDPIEGLTSALVGQVGFQYNFSFGGDQ